MMKSWGLGAALALAGAADMRVRSKCDSPVPFNKLIAASNRGMVVG